MNRFLVLFKSTAVRLSALYILLFAICAATLVFYVTAMSERLMTNQISRGRAAGGRSGSARL